MADPLVVIENLIAKFPSVQDTLDELVTDGYIQDAINVNSEGLQAQMEYLLQYDTLDGILAELHLPPGINPLTGERT